MDNKMANEKINYFVDAAAKEFKLDKKAKEKFLKLRTAYVMDYIKTNKQANATFCKNNA